MNQIQTLTLVWTVHTPSNKIKQNADERESINKQKASDGISQWPKMSSQLQYMINAVLKSSKISYSEILSSVIVLSTTALPCCPSQQSWLSDGNPGRTAEVGQVESAAATDEGIDWRGMFKAAD